MLELALLVLRFLKTEIVQIRTPAKRHIAKLNGNGTSNSLTIIYNAGYDAVADRIVKSVLRFLIYFLENTRW